MKKIKLNLIAFKIVQALSKGHTYTNPWSGQYLTHAHSHITHAVTQTAGLPSLGPNSVTKISS